MDKYVHFNQTHSYTSQESFLQDFCSDWSTSIFGTQQQWGWAAFLAASARAQSL